MMFSQLVARLYTQSNSTLLIRFGTVGENKLSFIIPRGYRRVVSSPSQCYEFFSTSLTRFENFAKCLEESEEIWKFIPSCCCGNFEISLVSYIYILVGRGRIRDRGNHLADKMYMYFCCFRVRNNGVEIRFSSRIVYSTSLTVLKK